MNFRPPQIRDSHLARKAGVYIRQSSEAQVRDHPGSSMLQRGLVEIARAWGWREPDIELRDDLGASADEPQSREEFERLLRDMAAGRVGAVFVSAFSRLGRNELDQAYFQVAARIHDVLLVVGTTVYDFLDPNSAFAAGLLGHGAVLEHRLKIGHGRESRRLKAEAGFEPTAPPVGFEKPKNAPYIKSSDDRVRETIQLVWDKMLELRSARAVVRHLRQHGIQLPRRVRGGQIAWCDATWSAVLSIVKTPAYAGIYVFGTTRVIEAVDADGIRKRQIPTSPAEWIVKEGLHPGFVTPAQFYEVQALLKRNCFASLGAPGRGDALLQRLLRCSVHGERLWVRYNERERLPDGTVRFAGRYFCTPETETGCSVTCSQVSARRIDPIVEAAVLSRLGRSLPDEIRSAFAEEVRQHEALIRARDEQLRRAQRQAAEHEREYFAVAPDHHHWKQRLSELVNESRGRIKELQAKAALEPALPPEMLRDEELEELRLLLSDLPSLWQHPSVTAGQKKTVLRLLIKDLVATPGPEEWKVTIYWATGGFTTLTFLTRRGAEALATHAVLSGQSIAEVADRLTQAGGTPLPGKPGYTARSARTLVWRIRKAHGFRERAYRLIHHRYRDGARNQAIARELVAADIPGERGPWNANGVSRVIRSMTLKSFFGLPRLSRSPRLKEEVRRLNAAGLDEQAILDQLIEAGCVTWHRRQPTLRTVKFVLWQLRYEAAEGKPVGWRRRH